MNFTLLVVVLADGNRFRGYRHRALQCDSTPFVQCTEDGSRTSAVSLPAVNRGCNSG